MQTHSMTLTKSFNLWGFCFFFCSKGGGWVIREDSKSFWNRESWDEGGGLVSREEFRFSRIRLPGGNILSFQCFKDF